MTPPQQEDKQKTIKLSLASVSLTASASVVSLKQGTSTGVQQTELFMKTSPRPFPTGVMKVFLLLALRNKEAADS